MDDIGDRVRKALEGHLTIPASEVADTARFVEDLGVASVDMVEIIMALEDEFEVENSDAAAEEMLTVGDVVAFLKGKAG